MGDRLQQLPGLAGDPLAVDHVTGIVERHHQRGVSRCRCTVRLLQRLQGGGKRGAEAPFGQEFVHVLHRTGEAGFAAAEQVVIGLHRVAAAGGRHQHGIQRVVSCCVLEALHQVGGQRSRLAELALVVAHRAAAPLRRWHDHFEAVGLEHGHGGGVHLRIKTALHAAQH